MNQRSDIDRLLRHWMDDGPTRMPDRIVDVVAERISVQRQRRSWRLLRRLPMNPLFKLAATAAAVLVVAVVGWRMLPGTGGVGGEPTPLPTPTVAPSPTAAPSPSPEPTAPPLTGSHASELYGLTVSYPDGWVVNRTGTEDWTTAALPGWGSPIETGDYISYPGSPDQLFILVSSHALEGESGSAWADAIAAEPDPGLCPTFDTIVVAGLDGRLYNCNEPLRALFWSADRGYLVAVHRSDALPWAADVYDLAWLNDLLETVSLQ